MEIQILIAAVVGLLLFDLLAIRFGVETREDFIEPTQGLL